VAPRVKESSPAVIARGGRLRHSGAIDSPLPQDGPMNTRAQRLIGASLVAAGQALATPAGPAAVPSTTRHLAIGEGRLAYDDTGGSGPLVLAIPGMGDLRAEYRALRPLLQQAGYRVVTMDVRGHGESSATWSDYSARAVGRDALALIEHLGAGPAVLLGNSFAAGSALWAAHEAPAQVRGVVLLGPIVRDGSHSWFAKAAVAVGFAGPWRVGFWTTYWNSLFPTRKPTDHDEARAALAANLREPGRMEALRTMVGLSKADTEALVAGGRLSTRMPAGVPALVVMGTRDPDFPDAVAEARWLGRALGTEPLIVEGAGHYPHLEMPEQVAPRLLAFIGGLASQ